MDIDIKIQNYLRSKYNKSRKLPDIVKIYKDNPNRGWTILALNWKKKLLLRYTNDIKSLSIDKQNIIIEDAIKKGI